MIESHVREGAIYQGSKPLEIDRAACLIKGVRFLGLTSKNGYDYSREAVAKAIAAGVYEGVKVNIDHSDAVDGPPGPRKFADRFGRLVNTRQDPDGGGRADLKYNPKHHAAESVLWAAENDPELIGLSQDAYTLQTAGANGRRMVVEISKVYSVDLVGDPATTNGLREEQCPMNENEKLGVAVSAILADASTTPDQKRGRLLEQVKLPEARPEPAALPTDEAQAREWIGRSGSAGLKAVLARLDGYEVREAHEARKATVIKLCQEAALPDFARTDVFVEQVAAEQDPTRQKALVEDRKRIITGQHTTEQAGAGGPTSAGKVDQPADFDGFLKAINTI
jgi:hypothetical protein